MSRLKIAGECWIVLEASNGDTAARKFRQKVTNKHIEGAIKIGVSYFPALEGWVPLEYEDEERLWFLVRQFASKEINIHIQIRKEIKYISDKTGRVNWCATPHIVKVWREPSNSEYLTFAIHNEWDKIPEDRHAYLKSWIEDETPLVKQLRDRSAVTGAP